MQQQPHLQMHLQQQPAALAVLASLQRGATSSVHAQLTLIMLLLCTVSCCQNWYMVCAVTPLGGV